MAPLELVYDGDCGLCRDLVDYAGTLLGEQVRFAPYQEVADDHPEVPREHFAETIVLFGPEGARCEGAEAAYELLALAPGRGFWRVLYRHLPGFAALSEAGYRFVAARRAHLRRPMHLLYGAPPLPVRLERTHELVAAGVAACFVLAFVSLAVQVPGLYASDGIRPIARLFALLELGEGTRWLPSLFHLDASDATLVAAAWGGAGLALIAMLRALAGRSFVAPLIGAWALQLSFVAAGDVFLAYQWDALLLEAGLLCVLGAHRPWLGTWALRLLAVRFVFASGWVKLASNDANWAQGTALNHHFETQPLPGPLSWWAHQLPESVLRGATVAVLVVELLVPLLLFAPRRARALGAFMLLALQLAIVATGNYGWFNLLTMVLCLALLDDRALGVDRSPARSAVPRRSRLAAARTALLALVTLLALLQTVRTVLPGPMPAPLATAAAIAERGRIANAYGVFAIMTTRRDELVVEGSVDGREWRAYTHRWKPGDPSARPPQVAPHQPRLDWQFWFAALSTAERTPWMRALVVRLAQRSPSVEALFAEVPFAADETPRFFRVRRLRYGFVPPAEREVGGVFWSRRDLGLWMGPVEVRSGR